MMNSTGYGQQQRLYFDGDENKYEQWEVKMLAYMRLRKLKDTILPDSNVVATSDKKEEAFSELVQLLDDRSLNLVMRDAKDDGRKALEILRQYYAGSGKQRIISLYTQLTSLSKQQHEQLIDYIIRAETAATSLKTAGEIVSDGLLIAMVLKGLPSTYKPFIVVTTQADKTQTFQDFKISLRSYEELNEKATSSNEKVLKVGHQQNYGKNYYHNRNSRNENYNNYAATRNENKPNKGRGFNCYACGLPGHKSADCTNKPQNTNSKWCSNCKSSSHTNKACRNNKPWKNNYNNRDAANRINTGSNGETSERDEHTFVFGVSSDVLCNINIQDNEIKPDLLLVDCGATAHIINDESKFIHVDEDYNPNEHFIELADGKRKSNIAKKRGTVTVNIRDEDGELRKANLDNALFVPSFPQNIFSVRAAAEKGATVRLSENDGELITADGVKFPIKTIGRLYYLNMCKPSVKPLVKQQRSSTLEGWHRILGHVNKSDIIKLENVVDDMKITKKENFDCTTCILSKQTVTKNREADKRAEVPLQLVHTDLSGAVDPVAKDGFRYVINFVDDYSGAVFLYCLKQKSDAFHALRKFISDSAPYGKVKRLRSDNGGEFISEQFEAETLSNKFKHEFSAPHTPHQNGTAERNWRTLFEIARCMLIESKLPRYLWTYAVLAAAHIRNRVFSQRIRDTPYHLLTGNKPNISRMHVFGSVCFPYIHIKKKLDPRSEKGLFVGYDRNSPSYLVYFPETRKVTKNHTVKFTEQYDVEYRKRFYTDETIKINDETERDEKTYDEVILYPKDEEIHEEVTSDEIETEEMSGEKSVRGEKSHEGVTSDEIETEVMSGEKSVRGEKSHEEVTSDEIETEVMSGDNGERRYPKRNRTSKQEENRYPQRNRNVPKHLEDYSYSIDSCHKTTNVPKTYKEATKSVDSKRWRKAMDSEMKSLKDNNTFTVVTLPKGNKAVGSRWTYALKSDPDGNVIHKARFVAKGYAQVEGLDYSDTFSPTAKMTTVRLMMQFAVEYNMLVHQLDVKTAYLNAPIDRDIYILQPQGYEKCDNENVLVWKLNRSLYGLKQSGRNWNIVLSDFFKENGFTRSEVDACLYLKKSESSKIFIVIWVDDIVIATNTNEQMNQTKDLLKNKYRMKDLGQISWFLGIQFLQTTDGIEMSQEHYLKGVLERFQMSDCKPRSTPCEAKIEADKSEEVTDNDESDVKRYREIVGSLVYASTCTRPDLAWVVTKLSQHLAKPTNIDWITVKHVLRYVKGSTSRKLIYRKSKGLKITGYSDSDWASSVDRRSTTGYYFCLNPEGPAVSWKSRKQPTVALSSCEAEYMALTTTSQEALFLSMIVKDFDMMICEPIQINGDNQGSIALVKNPINQDKSKHIDIKFHFIREKYANGQIEIVYIPTSENVADLMTKPATKVKLDKFRKLMFGDNP